MKIMSVGELKTHFSDALKNVEAGERIAIAFGKKKEIKAYLIPKEQEMKPRKLDVLNNEEGFFLREDFTTTTDQEFPI